MYNNNSTDARTFPEIWGKLNQDEKSDLSAKLFAAKCCGTPQTIWNWGTGKTRPAPLVRKEIANVVSKFIGTRVFGATLFPAS